MHKPTQNINHINKRIPANKTIWVTGPTEHFLNDYIQTKQLGNAGQYGVTYQCIRKSDGKCFAVKRLNKYRYPMNANLTHQYLKKLSEEVNILKALHHDNIIKLEGIYEDKSTLYIVMEECKGGELLTRIYQKSRFCENDAANIMKQLLSALQYMHDDIGVVHRDLHPNNILFLSEDEDSLIKIIDFGMSKFLPRLQFLDNKCGSRYYIAPEIIQNKKYNHSCDMWSVGVILYVMIYGYPPFYVEPKKYGKYERQAIYSKIIHGFEPKLKSTLQHGFGPWFADHIKTSEDVRDLISKLLQTQSRKRYTAKEALTHPWFVKKRYNDDIDSIIMSRLVGFNQKDAFKLIISILFRNEFCKMRFEHFQQLKELFIKYDRDKDDVWSYKEFEAMIDQIHGINIDNKYLQIIYQRLSSSLLGIKFSDLLNALVYDYLSSCDYRLGDAFRKLDDNQDGKITIKELTAKLKRIDPSGEWIKAIQVIADDDVINFDEFLLRLHPNFVVKPEWIQNLFKLKPSKYKQNNGDNEENKTEVVGDENDSCFTFLDELYQYLETEKIEIFENEEYDSDAVIYSILDISVDPNENLTHWIQHYMFKQQDVNGNCNQKTV